MLLEHQLIWHVFEHGHLLDKLLWISSSLCVLVSTPFLYYWPPLPPLPFKGKWKMVEAIIYISVWSGCTRNFFPWYFKVWRYGQHFAFYYYHCTSKLKYRIHNVRQVGYWHDSPWLFFNFSWKLFQHLFENIISCLG